VRGASRIAPVGVGARTAPQLLFLLGTETPTHASRFPWSREIGRRVSSSATRRFSVAFCERRWAASRRAAAASSANAGRRMRSFSSRSIRSAGRYAWCRCSLPSDALHLGCAVDRDHGFGEGRLVDSPDRVGKSVDRDFLGVERGGVPRVRITGVGPGVTCPRAIRVIEDPGRFAPLDVGDDHPVHQSLLGSSHWISGRG
jgi:hypothetical protein